MSAVEKELQKASGVKPKGSEPEQNYLKRLVDSIGDLKDDEWDKLSTSAQNWVNAGQKALNNGEEVAPFTDKEEDDTKKEATEQEETVATKNAKKNGKAPAKKKAAAKPEKTKAAAPKKRDGGAQVAIKRLVIKDPKISSEDIAKKLGSSAKVTVNSISTIRSGTLQTLRLVKEIGLPKGDF